VRLKRSLCLIEHHDMKTYGGWRYCSTILVLGIRWKWLASRPGRSISEETVLSGSHLIGGWVGLREPLWTLWRREKSLAPAGYRTTNAVFGFEVGHY
jgi:hypothetical protein